MSGFAPERSSRSGGRVHNRRPIPCFDMPCERLTSRNSDSVTYQTRRKAAVYVPSRATAAASQILSLSSNSDLVKQVIVKPQVLYCSSIHATRDPARSVFSATHPSRKASGMTAACLSVVYGPGDLRCEPVDFAAAWRASGAVEWRSTGPCGRTGATAVHFIKASPEEPSRRGGVDEPPRGHDGRNPILPGLDTLPPAEPF
jgi:hypothetical protein